MFKMSSIKIVTSDEDSGKELKCWVACSASDEAPVSEASKADLQISRELDTVHM